MSNKIDEMLNAAKLNELIHRKQIEDDKKSAIICILAVIGAIAAVAAIAFAVFKYFAPD